MGKILDQASQGVSQADLVVSGEVNAEYQIKSKSQEIKSLEINGEVVTDLENSKKTSWFTRLKKLFGFGGVVDEVGSGSAELVAVVSTKISNGAEERKSSVGVLKAAYDLSFNGDKLSPEQREEAMRVISGGNSIIMGTMSLVTVLQNNVSSGYESLTGTKIKKPSDIPATTDKRWYEDDDIQKGLKASQSNGSNVNVFGAVPAQSCDLLKQNIKTAKSQAEEGETALMPFNVGNDHWVGGAMTKIGDKVCFVHNDPMGNKINQSLEKELIVQKVVIIDLQQKQQHGSDTYNCGPFTVDNLTKFSEAAKSANNLGLSKDEFKSRLKIDLESGAERGQKLRDSQTYSPTNLPNRSSGKDDVGRGG